jgi:hypothetical protein
MKNLLLVLVLCLSLVGCGAVSLENQQPIQPIEVQLLVKIAATQLMKATEPDAQGLNELHAWTNRGVTMLGAVDPTHPEKLHEALMSLSEDPSIPPEYSDVAALVMIMLTSRVNIQLEASEDLDRALSLSEAALKGIQLAIEAEQRTHNIRIVIYQ